MLIRLLIAVCLLAYASIGSANTDGTARLVVGSEQDYPPFAIGKTAATADGFTVDLWKAVARAAGLEYDLRVLPFNEILRDFKEGKVDVLINLAQSDERRKYADFSIPHVTVHGAIFMRDSEQGIHSEQDLGGKSIIVVNADIAHEFANAKGWQDRLVTVKTAAEGLRLLAAGRHDALLVNRLVGLQTLRTLKIDGIKVVELKADFPQKFAFAVRKGNAELLAHINDALATVKANGTYDVLHEKWFNVYEVRGPTSRDLLPYLLPAALVMLAVAGYFLRQRQNERHRSETALQQSEERLRLALAAADQGLYDLNVQTGEAIVSPGYATMLGYDPADFHETNAAWLARLHPDDRDRVTATFRDYIGGKLAAYQVEFRQRMKSGDWKWILSQGKIVARDADNNPLRMLGTHTDITARRRADEALRSLQARLEFLLTATPVVIYSCRSDGDYAATFVSGNVTEQFGYQPSEFTGNASFWLDHVHPDDRGRVLEELPALFDTGSHAHEYRFRHQNGSYRWVRDEVRVVHDSHGKPLELVGYWVDITDHRLAEAAVRDEHNLLSAIINSSTDFIFAKDRQLRTFLCNEAFADALGKRPAELYGKTDIENGWPEELVKGDPDRGIRGFEQDDLDSLSGKRVRNENDPATVRDEVRIFDTVKLPLRNAEGKIIGILGMSRDVTERRALQAELERKALLDYLTGIPNRRHFMELGEAELLRAQRYDSPLSMLMLDIDHFKQLNDTYGHKTGDLVLQQLSRIFKSALREVDIPARLGGEEFAILLPETDGARAVEAAERLREKIATTKVPLPAGLPVHFTVSIGVVTLTGRQVNMDMLLSQADEALYRAKNSGRNTVCAAH